MHNTLPQNMPWHMRDWNPTSNNFLELTSNTLHCIQCNRINITSIEMFRRYMHWRQINIIISKCSWIRVILKVGKCVSVFINSWHAGVVYDFVSPITWHQLKMAEQFFGTTISRGQVWVREMLTFVRLHPPLWIRNLISALLWYEIALVFTICDICTLN